MKTHLCLVLACLGCAPFQQSAAAQPTPPETACRRPGIGSSVPEPADLRSVNGELKIDLTIRNFPIANGSTQYCYIDGNGNQAPTLRLKPGDLLVLNLKNELSIENAGPHRMASMAGTHDHVSGKTNAPADACNAVSMDLKSTNLHFHGLSVASICHQDEVLKTAIRAGDPPFEYRFRIPTNQPPGLYWYHPHIHGFSKVAMLGGASGAMVIEGLERANSQVVGLPERVLVIRDQDLLNPNARPAASEPVLPKMLIDRDGDSANNGTGFGMPAKDLSINFVPVPYPDYPPAVINMRPGEKQLWRVLNASAITYLNLAVVIGRVPQALGLVALDGVPITHNGTSKDLVSWQNHLGLPPGGRAEFIIAGPPLGTKALLVTRTVDTGPGGENDPNRQLATITAAEVALEPRYRLEDSPQPLAPNNLPWLGSVAPVRTRKLYFSEKLTDPTNPNSATEFYVTVEGQKPMAFDPASTIPNIVAQQGTVEDWIIENRSNELHAFHIHQIHFMLMDYLGVPVNEPFLRDTVNVPFLTDRALNYPTVRIRLDFRDPNAAGTYPYHCHLLEHEDLGMMGIIRVEPASGGGPTSLLFRNKIVEDRLTHQVGR